MTIFSRKPQPKIKYENLQTSNIVASGDTGQKTRNDHRSWGKVGYGEWAWAGPSLIVQSNMLRGMVRSNIILLRALHEDEPGIEQFIADNADQILQYAMNQTICIQLALAYPDQPDPTDQIGLKKAAREFLESQTIIADSYGEFWINSVWQDADAIIGTTVDARLDEGYLAYFASNAVVQTLLQMYPDDNEERANYWVSVHDANIKTRLA